jgi:hypothetical protein
LPELLGFLGFAGFVGFVSDELLILSYLPQLSTTAAQLHNYLTFFTFRLSFILLPLTSNLQPLTFYL